MYELIEYNCFNCHTKFLVYDNILLKCPNCYTKDFKVTKKQVDLDIKTLKINYSKTNFLKEIKKVIKKYPFLPDEFLKLKKLNETELKTIYIPAILYNAKINTNLEFNNKLTKKSKIKFNQVLFELTKLDKNIISKLKPFNYFEIDKLEDLENILIEELDSEFNKVKEIKDKLINLYEENELKKLEKNNQDIKITNNNYNFLDESYQILYLPIYYFEFLYRDKIYKFLMNPSTGKFNYEIINSKLKIILFLLSILIFTGLFTYCMYMLFESNAFKRWFSYLIIFDIVLLIWLFKKCRTEVIPINKQSLVYETIEEIEGD